jgi:lipopolysaccharide assembly outer membrane protein LptD (OstA)
LIDSDETTLEIRADNQSQTGNEFKAEGNAEAERQKDLLKADTILYDTINKNLSASGNVKYFEQDISVYSNAANYSSSKNEINFSRLNIIYLIKVVQGTQMIFLLKIIKI